MAVSTLVLVFHDEVGMDLCIALPVNDVVLDNVVH